MKYFICKKKKLKKNKKKTKSSELWSIAVWHSSVCVILRYSISGVYLKVRRGGGSYIQSTYHAKLMIVHQSLFSEATDPGYETITGTLPYSVFRFACTSFIALGTAKTLGPVV